MEGKFFTSESVTEGHPDKLCDQVSDAILDSIISQDPYARVACETMATTGLVMVMGEISTKCYVDIPKVVRKVIADIGYVGNDMGFDSKTCSVITTIDEQSPDIARGVDQGIEVRGNPGLDDKNNETGAGDQGMVFGYACNETEELMPLPISLAHRLAKRLTELRKTGVLPYLRPDGKTQVTVRYVEDKPFCIDTVVVSSQHTPEVSMEDMRNDIINKLIREVIPGHLLTEETKYYINPTGRFVTGGPQGDSGLTGRKIIVDTYGGYARHGGGAFSGKDPTKVDRSGAYAARYVAKNIVAAGLADKCEVQISYAIGVASPVSLYIDTFGTGKVEEELLTKAVYEVFDLRPAAIILELDLRRPIYRQLSKYGHIGRTDLNVRWEDVDKAGRLREFLGMD